MADEPTTEVARVCWHDELLTDPCQECDYDVEDGRCNGSDACNASLHVHGCYADRDGVACTDPGDHEDYPPVPSQEADRG